MKIKKYKGKRIDEVMKRIKQELGDDAVILSTKKNDEGVEILAATDLAIDEEPRQRVELVEVVKKEEIAVKDNDSDLERLMLEVEELKRLVLSERERSKELENLKKEISLVRRILESGAFSNVALTPEIGPICELLKEHEVDKKIVDFIIRKISENELLSPYAVCEEELLKILKTASFEPVSGVPIVLSGPTGVGKTTTLAKIASMLKFYEGKDVAIISIDTYRIGAIDQVKIYADILEIDFFSAEHPGEFSKIVDLLKDKVILVDTAGSSHKDDIRRREIATFLEVLKQYLLYVVIPYYYRLKEAIRIIEAFSYKRPDGLILTKLDEAEVYGLPVNLSWYFDIPIVFITTGQRVPEDIEEADPHKMTRYLLKEEES
ncbi:flagellar biosynthesis protein FlhF [Thermosulfidibacter takaii ABI70S6]|uniref:Flagellar biosynthesis protein FlhF n=1 Tax=Thermosulfidibacter takaii (strain DSM 17441 / JCM 13301 / NBRC 103674 / ABI70S6) TaxID=1298851 RepID=A0A0S3QT03_THET7|nr:flagellar biosynthesis protein FlhF [Thermosulfidibacter takaii]BAT71455.1 flagellar biosynthesis protein FlhF [Thermosulfidibacter takaii ABI70S6]